MRPAARPPRLTSTVTRRVSWLSCVCCPTPTMPPPISGSVSITSHSSCSPLPGDVAGDGDASKNTCSRLPMCRTRSRYHGPRPDLYVGQTHVASEPVVAHTGSVHSCVLTPLRRRWMPCVPAPDSSRDT